MTKKAVFAVPLVVIGALAGCAPPERVLAEVKKRSEYVKGLAIKERVEGAWSLNSRHNIAFFDGMSSVTFIDKTLPEPGWSEIWDPYPTTRQGDAVRWLNRDAHLKVKGTQRMRFYAHGRIRTKVVFTRPTIEVYVDGSLYAVHRVKEDGWFEIAFSLDAETIATWTDVYIVTSGLHEPDRAPGEPHLGFLDRVDWEPVQPP